MLVSELAGVNWLWPFMVLGQIYGCKNFGHNFCQLALLGKALCVLGDGDVGAELGAGSRAQPALRHQHRHCPLPAPGGQTGVAGPSNCFVWVVSTPTYEESPRGAASGLTRCNFFILQTSLLSLFLVQMG